MPAVPATVMSCSVTEMEMMGHVQMNVQRAAQKRECGIGEADNETDQIKNFPVHGFTSLNIAPLIASLDVATLDIATLGLATLGIILIT